MMRTVRHAFLFACALGGTTAQGIAESGQFNVSFGGIRAGILAYDGQESGGRYSVNGAARASGLLGAIFDASVDTAAQGRVSGNRYAPSAAREVTREDGETVQRVFRYPGGVPSLTRTPPRSKPQKHAVAASGQKGTVDTTTAAFAILRDRPAGLACDLDVSIFDGAKRHRIQFSRSQKTSKGLICHGTYTRIAGFSPKEMAEQVKWPLQMDYEQLSDGNLRVTGLTFKTSFGKARIRRR